MRLNVRGHRVVQTAIHSFYSSSPKRTFSLTICIVSYLFLCDIRTVCGQNSANDCDWSGSGLSPEVDAREVRPIYLRCSQGKIHWKYPRGGLLVVLKYGTAGKDFKGCIRASRNFTGARIYLQGHRTLHPLYSVDDKKHKDLPRCFVSYKGQVSLFVETDSLQNYLDKNVAEFSYDLQLRSKKSFMDDQEECRPCTNDEMLLHYCINDFVVKGFMTGIHNNKELERTEISVRTSRVIRETHPVLDKTSQERIGEVRKGTFHIPLKCGADIDDGEFLILGKVILGNPVIQCAPRVEDWVKIRDKAVKEYKNQCLLE